MDQGPLVETKIEAGKKLIERLTQEGITVTVACWLKEADGGLWFLYVASSLVGADRGTRKAYGRLDPLMRELQAAGFWLDWMEVKLISPTDLIAVAAQEFQRRYPRKMAIWNPSTQFGFLSVDEAYIYPPLGTAAQEGKTEAEVK